MYACFITFFFSVELWDLRVAPRWRRRGTLPFMRGVGQNGPKAPRRQGARNPLEIKDWFWGLIDLAIGPKDQESVKSTGEPAVVGHR